MFFLQIKRNRTTKNGCLQLIIRMITLFRLNILYVVYAPKELSDVVKSGICKNHFMGAFDFVEQCFSNVFERGTLQGYFKWTRNPCQICQVDINAFFTEIAVSKVSYCKQNYAQ